jgi:hypothetical protein
VNIDTNSTSAESASAGTTQQKLNIVVTCMDRFDMIRQTIGPAIAQPNSTYTLVDYSCPKHTGEWVRDRYPEARVVFVKDRTSWHASEARNLGAKTVHDGLICFADSDTILQPGFSELVFSTLTPGTFVIIDLDAFDANLSGLVVCRQEDFVRCGGYDEIIRDWGSEDYDFLKSLTRLGLTETKIPPGLAKPIAHDDSIRTQHCNIKEMESSNRANGFYSMVKHLLLSEGDEITTEQLRAFYRYSRDRLLAGYPWLAWPEGEIDPADFVPLVRHLFTMADGYQNLETDKWGSVRLFKINRDVDPVVELLSSLNSHLIKLRAPGHTTLDVANIYGRKTTVPVLDGECELIINAEPIFLPGDIALVHDAAVLLTPALGPALAVDVTPGPECNGVIQLSVAIDGEIVDERELPCDAGVQHLKIPVPPEQPERPRMAEVTLKVGGRIQVAKRRTTFLSAPRVTRGEASQSRAPDRIYRYTLNEVQTSFGDQARPSDGWEALSAEVAWGWTETEFVCWIARWDDVAAAASTVIVGIDAPNQRSLHCDAMDTRAHLAPERRAEYQKWRGDIWMPMDDAVSIDRNGRHARAVLRIPFDIIESVPAVGQTMGVSIFINDSDGRGATRSLAWGGGIVPTRNARFYNEITLEG